MTRLLLVSGALCVSMGVTWLIPLLFELFEREFLSETARAAVWLGPALIVGGVILLVCGFGKGRQSRMPDAVRIAVTGNVLFLSFCAMELSDGLVRQGGRIFYWTTVLFLPGLVLLYGLTLAQRWAGWSARGLTALFTLWFLGFAVLIPFADLYGQGGPVPPQGRVFMIGLSLAFASAAAYVFRGLGRTEARDYLGILRRAEPNAAPTGGPAGLVDNSNAPGGPPSVS